MIEDGARVIVDASPRGLAGQWAQRTLSSGGRQARADVCGVDGLANLFETAARLVVAGANVDVTRLVALSAHRRPSKSLRVEHPAVMKPLSLPRAPAVVEVMTPPPPLPRILPRITDEPAVETPAPSDMVAQALLQLRHDALVAHEGALASMQQAHADFLAHRQALADRVLRLASGDVNAAGVPAVTFGSGAGVPPVAEAPSSSRAHLALWSRADLEKLASGRISDVWGPPFDMQDGFRRQVRMPEPPLLLADRVMSIDATPGVLEKNRSIVTETDLTWDLWYLHEGRCPAGILIETGQADLLLVSYMGVDFENKGERVYRLLGCDLTYQAPLPRAGVVLQHDIHVDGYAVAPMKGGDTRIFFFHSDTYVLDDHGNRAELVLSVRNGQAGFFTDAELDDSGGILWTPADVKPESVLALPHAPPPRPTKKRAFTRSDLEAFARGDALTCFGDGFERAATHVRTPRIQPDRMLLVDRVTDLDFAGGPWRRGYLRAELDLVGDNWFFAGHFKDDPCMPGTVIFEGCLETLGIYLAAAGFTLERDGFRFEPVTKKAYALRCRGQATPSSRKLVYEVFVKALVDGPEPSVVADILVTVDGLKSLHCDSVELKLARDFPLSSRPDLTGEVVKANGDDAVGGVGSSLPAVFDQTALLATGIGRPSQGFPGLYEPFDEAGRVPRLPGPPYHFMSRVVDVSGPPQGALARGEDATGTAVVVEYDVPPDAWFFREAAPSQGATMPFAVLLEVALQPCGFVSSLVGSALTTDKPLYYRNLDGNARVHRELGRDCGTLVVKSSLTKSSSSGGMIIQELTFDVTLKDGSPVFDGTTVFGFFPAEALARQVGTGSSPEERARMAERCAGFDVVDLRARPEKYFNNALALPDPMLLMIDRVTGYWPRASKMGLARVRTEKLIDPREWFFQAHFFQDPVQPGSLGVEAMIQALMWLAIEEGRGRGMNRPRFESLATDEPVVWKYRGQVIPENKLVQVELDLISVDEDRATGAVTLRSNASLWCDGTKIYEATGLALRVVEGG
jgi:3-hydroxymyristoyl/3-hydroxydecanoyl-(acyl carrier protein) dehydratase